MKIILVRHGESEANARKISQSENQDWSDTPLTKTGVQQVKLLGRKLKGQKINYIYSSNLKRARQIAEIISKIINVSIRDELGELQEYKGKILKSRIKVLLNFRLKKLKKLLDKVSKDRHDNKTILIVAHGITNRIVLGYFLDIPLKKQLLFFQQHNSCLNLIRWDEEYENWQLVAMNDISHLPIKLSLENR